MRKLINLTKEDIRNLYNATEHFQEDEVGTEAERMQIICDWLKPHKDSDNLKWELHVEEIVPQTADNVLNYITAQLSVLSKGNVWGSDQQIWLENQFWDIMKEQYGFDHEEHPTLLKCTAEDAQKFAMLEVAKRNPQFYSEEVAFE